MSILVSSLDLHLLLLDQVVVETEVAIEIITCANDHIWVIWGK